MSGSLNIVVIIGVIALVFVRQFSAQRISSEGKAWWLIPVVLTVMALRQPGLVDPAHHMASGVLLGAEVLIGLACGAGWAWTTRIWTGDDGAVWTKGSWAAAGVWACGMALRVGLMGIAAVLGIHQGSAATLLSVAAMLLTRAGVTTWRAQGLQRTYRVPVAG
ncbi:DUF1453 domain-containing protein [Streptomyces kronopolitis]|uniref:DUF1453 domain-containing protein n=1 Tax=Streptomyces kronopolitis TaxID=1612435 RepID=UPI0020BD6E69|nr:DUF1453 domain-containing protein [Streptomyces kronopolitis]MCL6300632.1 DUF1453 domain-containing protein [Streptomyces kronopolitis]